MQRVTVIKLNNDDIKMILSKHFDVPLEKENVKDGNDN